MNFIDVCFFLYSNVKWFLFTPLKLLIYRSTLHEPHPFTKTTYNANNTSNQHIDFYGPFILISIYGLFLLIIRVNNVPWLYLIWLLGAVFNHLVCRVWCNNTSIQLQLSLLGYSIAPLCIFSIFIYVTRKIIFLSLILQFICIIYCTSITILSYYMICNTSSQVGTEVASVKHQSKWHKVSLLIPPVLLMQIYLLSMIPSS